MRTGLGYLFDRSLEMWPDRPALLQDDIVLSYGELDERSNKVAQALLGSGIKKGDRVALLFDNDYRFLEAFFGILRMGGIVVPVNYRLQDDVVRYIIVHSDARALICSGSQTERAAAWLDNIPSVEIAVGIQGDGAKVRSYHQWLEGVTSEPPAISVAEDDVALQPYTSGSTGRPKGCLLSHGGQLWNSRVMAKHREIRPTDKVLVAAPLCHKNAMASIKPLLLIGGTIVLLREFTPEGYLAAISRQQITCTSGVPAMYRMLFQQPELFRRYDTTSVRFCFVGSAAVPPDLQSIFPRFFPNAVVREGYGSTEGGPVSLMQPADGSSGLLPLEDCLLKIIRDDGSECLPGETGELVIKNPGLLQAYYKDPEATAASLRDGWYYTGDLAKVTPEGRYFIVGRKDDRINCGGENVYPKEIEDILHQHPGVADVCVVGLSHHIKGEVPVAFVVLNDDADIPDPEAELKSFFFERGPAFAHPRHIFVIPELPLSAPGKIDRNELRRWAEVLVSGRQKGVMS